MRVPYYFGDPKRERNLEDYPIWDCRLSGKLRSRNLAPVSQQGVSENRGPEYGTLNSRILIIGPPNKVPQFSETPTWFLEGFGTLGTSLQGLRALGLG